jgi:hypothetical protein
VGERDVSSGGRKARHIGGRAWEAVAEAERHRNIGKGGVTQWNRLI